MRALVESLKQTRQNNPHWKDIALGLFLFVTPHRFASGLMHFLTRCRFKPWKNWQMRWFIPRYQVNMDEVLDPNLNNYPNFNTFFTRELKPGVRPITEVANGLACPADGALYQLGDIEGDTLIEAKGHNFSLTTLLGGDAQRAAPFVGGHYTTIYLSPKDYHRVHMPYTGVLHEMIHVPGRLYSVNPRTTRTIPGVFARNERVVSIFETEYGPMAVILVGAMFVGSIETVWAGCLTDTPIYSPQVTRYNTEAEERIELKKGDELGRFNMGSTVILVFAKDRIKWENSLQTGQTTQLGQLFGHLQSPNLS